MNPGSINPGSMNPGRRRARFHLMLWGGLGLVALAALAGVVVGTSDLSAGVAIRVLLHHLLPWGWVDLAGVDPIDDDIVWAMRTPRVVLAGMVGGSLALAGAVMQGIFRNPLAAPGVIGTSAGGAFGALVAISLGLSLRSMFYVPLFAVVGALASLWLVLRIATRDGFTPVATLLLAGVAINAFIGAANGWIIAQSWSEWEVARRIAFWMMGGITDRDWSHVLILLPCLTIGAALAAFYVRDLDVMLEGDDGAKALGVDTERTRLVLLLACGLLTGGAVAVSGIVGFVGLIIPHLVRLLLGPGHRALLPISLISGAWFLILADLLARTATRPVELHLGVVTATVGAPFFLFLLRRHRTEGGLL